MSTPSATLERFSSLEAPHVRNRLPLWRVVEWGERLLAFFVLLIVLPVLIPVAFIIVILSRRSPLIAHRRIGQRGRPIWVLKLRTMWKPQDPVPEFRVVERLLSEATCPVIKPERDPRVTSRFAKLCRRYSIDELPQLWQIVTGDPALIGPRPLTAAEIDAHYGDVSFDLLSLKPGLSGLWQVKGRSKLTYAQRRKLDLFMIRKWSFGLYFRILFETVPSVVIGKNAW